MEDPPEESGPGWRARWEMVSWLPHHSELQEQSHYSVWGLEFFRTRVRHTAVEGEGCTGNGRVIGVDLDVKDLQVGEERLKVVGCAEVGELLALGGRRNGLERWGQCLGSDGCKIRNLGHTHRTHQGDLKV